MTPHGPIPPEAGAGTVIVSGNVEVKNDVGNPLPVNGTVEVTNDAGNPLPVSGTVAVSNHPATVEVTNDTGNPLPVSGTVAVSNYPATQNVASVPESAIAGHNQATAGLAAAQLGSSTALRGVVVKSVAANTGLVYVGSSASVTTANGFQLAKGESVSIPVNNSSDIWVIADTASQTVCWITV